MIIFINGPLGVGKTEVAWKLIEKFDRAVMLDGDYLGAVHPFEIDGEGRVTYLDGTMCHVARFHADHGWRSPASSCGSFLHPPPISRRQSAVGRFPI